LFGATGIFYDQGCSFTPKQVLCSILPLERVCCFVNFLFV